MSATCAEGVNDQIPIVDAHHHFWDPVENYHPWLRDEPMIPFRYGDYSSLRTRFMHEEYDRCARHWNVVGSVTMEGEWDPANPHGEALWMQALHEQTGKPSAHVAQAWLDRDDFSEILKRYERMAFVKSVRHKPRSNPQPGGAAGGMCDQAFRDGFRRLADHGLMFDLQTPWWHLHEAVELAILRPEVPIILNHCGLPSDRTENGLALWRKALEDFASVPQTFIKISGIGLSGVPWRLEDNQKIIDFCIATFGAERSMFASNFPVDQLCGSFDTIYGGYLKAAARYSPETQQLLFAGTACRVYQLDIDL